MKVLVIPSWYPPNGGMFFAHQTQWLMKEGMAASVIAVEEKSLRKIRINELPGDLRINRGIEFGIETYRKTRFRLPKANRINDLLWIETAVRLAEKYIHDNGQPDLIQVHSCMWAGYAASVIKEKYGIPYIIAEHRGRFNEKNYFRQQEILPWQYPYLKRALKQAGCIIPVSVKMISVLERIAGIKLPCIPVPNPVDENLFKPADVPDSKHDGTVFLTITNFLPYKAIGLLIDAFTRALHIESSIRLHFAGDGPGREEIAAQVNQSGIEDKVFFHGNLSQPEIRGQILASDFLVLSSYNEGQPVSIGETLLCGKPVICTDVVSDKDVPDFAGYIVETGNMEQLADVMIIAHRNKSLFEGSRIRSHALNRFSHKLVLSQITGVMKMVLNPGYEQNSFAEK